MNLQIVKENMCPAYAKKPVYKWFPFLFYKQEPVCYVVIKGETASVFINPIHLTDKSEISIVEVRKNEASTQKETKH